LNILPKEIAERLKNRPDDIIADRYEEASVLFADFAGFTKHASRENPEALVGYLNDVYSEFDKLVGAHGLEKVKTSGDAYIVVSGVPNPRPDHAMALADFALALRDRTATPKHANDKGLAVRIGIASGSIVAGVVGTKKFFYDIWGDAVNLASRMEQSSEPGKIQLSGKIRDLLKDHFQLESRGPLSVKGKGTMRAWFLNSRKPTDTARKSKAALVRVK